MSNIYKPPLITIIDTNSKMQYVKEINIATRIPNQKVTLIKFHSGESITIIEEEI